MLPIIRCKNVTLGYGREIVLKDISLDIPKGVFLPFIGPNGGGKTTLLRGILGLIKPSKGRIITPFNHAPAGYVPQHKSIDPLFPLTVRGIVKMGLYPSLGWWKKPGKEESKRVDTVLQELELSPHQHKNYRELSGGIKQKTLIARALISGAEIFILDEPTSELDEQAEKEVFDHLLRFVKQEGKTVLIVHHGIHAPIVRLSSEVCVVNHGKIKRIKTQELINAGGVL